MKTTLLIGGQQVQLQSHTVQGEETAPQQTPGGGAGVLNTGQPCSTPACGWCTPGHAQHKHVLPMHAQDSTHRQVSMYQ
jgi:hypothetical protein